MFATTVCSDGRWLAGPEGCWKPCIKGSWDHRGLTRHQRIIFSISSNWHVHNQLNRYRSPQPVSLTANVKFKATFPVHFRSACESFLHVANALARTKILSVPRNMPLPADPEVASFRRKTITDVSSEGRSILWIRRASEIVGGGSPEYKPSPLLYGILICIHFHRFWKVRVWVS